MSYQACFLVDETTGQRLRATEELVERSKAIRESVKDAADNEPAEYMIPKHEEFDFADVQILMDYLDLKKKHNPSISTRKSNSDDNVATVDSVPGWAQHFFEAVERTSKDGLFGAINMSVFLECPSFMHDACAYVARRTDDMKTAQLRDYFHENNDYTTDERAALRTDPDLREIMEADGILDEK